MLIDGVVFDLDHTLFDRYKTLEMCAPSLYEHFGHCFRAKYDLKSFINFIIDTDKYCIHYGWTAVKQRFFDNLIENKDEFNWDEYLDMMLDDCFFKYSAKYDFTEPMLDSLKAMGLKIGLITNGTGARQRAKLRNLEIDDRFDSILISGEFGAEKPDTALFYKMSKNLSIAPNRLLYVGDHPINDVAASKNAGYIPILVKTQGFFTMPGAEACEHIINNVGELTEYIKAVFS